MSVWAWIGEAAEGSAGAVGALVDWIGVALAGITDREARRRAAFSMALIALSAKMAKADGVVTADEEAAFHRLLAVPPGEAAHVDRLFDLAKQDVAGFESYAHKVHGLFHGNQPCLEDVLDGLFAIAAADSAVHEAELAYLARVAEIFEIDEASFERIAARHTIPEEGDPYAVLGADRAMSFRELTVRYRRLAAENHPDRLIGRGFPPEALALAHNRMATINRAWDRIKLEHAPSPEPV